MLNKKIIILIIILLLGFLTWRMYFSRTPKNILKKVFDIEVNSKIKEIYKNEKWSPNGDGYYISEIIIDDRTILSKFKRLPIKEFLEPNEIPNSYKLKNNGYYYYIEDEKDKRNFEIIIYDSHTRKMLIYYQIL